LRVRRVASSSSGARSASARRSVAPRSERDMRASRPAPAAARSRQTGQPSVTQYGVSMRRPATHNSRSIAPRDERAEEPAASPETADESSTTAVETSAACTALLASLNKADALLRCEIAVALGQLGDRDAMAPLERHLGDQDIRVRRAVAAALVQLGHPKGESLLAIAERTPAASMLMMARPVPRSRPRMSGGATIDGGTLAKFGGAVLAAALAGGGIWYWTSSTPSAKARRPHKRVIIPVPAAKKVVKSDD